MVAAITFSLLQHTPQPRHIAVLSFTLLLFCSIWSKLRSWRLYKAKGVPLQHYLGATLMQQTALYLSTSLHGSDIKFYYWTHVLICLAFLAFLLCFILFCYCSPSFLAFLLGRIFAALSVVVLSSPMHFNFGMFVVVFCKAACALSSISFSVSS